MMNNKIIIDNEEFEIIVNRKRIKNLYLRVKEENKIEVSANFYTTNKEILKIINDNKAFIIKANNKLKANKLKPNKIMYLGDELSLIESDKTFIDNLRKLGDIADEYQFLTYQYLIKAFPNMNDK